MGLLHSENYFLNSESCSENTPERSQSSENEKFPCGFPSTPGITPGVTCSENCGFRVAQVVRRHSENGTFAFRELFPELRELLREYPGTLPELREWPFHSESVFPEIGVGSQASD